MSCLKCGRETDELRAFCDDCTAEMERYPVKPGTVVILPSRKEQPIPKKVKSHRPAYTAEEQVKILKKRVRLLFLMLFITVALLAALIYPTVQFFLDSAGYSIGQNYSAITSGE